MESVSTRVRGGGDSE